jgi:hypothetical protein
MLQHLRQSVQILKCATWYHVAQQAPNTPAGLALPLLGYSTAAQQHNEQQQQQQQQQSPTPNPAVTSDDAVPLEDMNKYLDSSGELTFFDEPLELQQQQPDAATFEIAPLESVPYSNSSSSSSHVDKSSSSGSSSSITQAAALEGLSIHRKVKQSRSNVSAL